MSASSPHGAPDSRMRKVAGSWRLYLTATLLFTADMCTKLWVLNTIPEQTYSPPWKTIIPGFLNLVHIGNRGAAFGIFQGHSGILAVFAILALAAIYCFRRDLELSRHGPQIIFGLIIGGILGNFVDRVVHGHVIDFIDIHFPFAVPGIGYRFPAFNLADSGITTGVILYFFYSFFVIPRREKAAQRTEQIPPDNR